MVQRIRGLCKNKGITIAELERRCGIGNGIIARWGKSKPSYERLSKVAEELETTVEYLQTGSEQKEKPPAQGGEPIGPNKRALLELADDMSEEEAAALLEWVNLTRRMRDAQ